MRSAGRTRVRPERLRQLAATWRPPRGQAAIRSFVRRGSRSDRSPLVVIKGGNFEDPTVCGRCGAVFRHKTWRRRRRLAPALLLLAARDVCPACRQVERGEFFGCVEILGARAIAMEDAIRRRVANVAARARFTQPERRIVGMRRAKGALEVHTTSQKLAHRIVRELEKAFGGRGQLAWSDRGGRLYATWRLD
jgi:hypothetical protein